MPIPGGQAGPVKPRLGAVIGDSKFDYGIIIGPFTIGTENFTPTIPIQNDADFIILQSTYTNSLEVAAAAALPAIILNGGAVIQLSNGGDDRRLSNIQVPLASLFGTAQRPYWWPITYVFPAGGFIGINITGSGVANAGATIRLTFSGIKIRKGSAS